MTGKLRNCLFLHYSSESTNFPLILLSALDLIISACRIVLLYACLAEGVSPDGSHDSWAGNQDQATMGATSARVGGKKTVRTVARIRAERAMEA